MSDRAPPRLYYIAYPPEDVIACEICNSDDDDVREDARRQRGVFKAASRRQNYVHHLTRQHDVPAENVKIRCSVCGRVSEKPSRTAWRDTQTHHRRQHEGVRKVAVKPPLVANQAEGPLQGQEKKKAAAAGRRGDIDYVEKKEIVNGIIPKFSPIKNVGTGKIAATIQQEPKNALPNKSMIVSGMGKMFDVVVDNDPSQVLIHSTPSRSLKSAKASSLQKTGIEVSRIVPKTRPPVKRSLASQFEMASPRKRFHRD